MLESSSVDGFFTFGTDDDRRKLQAGIEVVRLVWLCFGYLEAIVLVTLFRDVKSAIVD